MFGGENSEKKVSVLSGGERSRLAIIRLLLQPVNLLILDEPTNHLDMPSKEVLKEAIKAFDGTAIIVSHDREFLDGLVTKVYEFGGGAVREHLGGIYDFLRHHKIDSLNLLGTSSPAAQPAAETATAAEPSAAKQNYAERREQQKRIRKVEKEVKTSEAKIEAMEKRLSELDAILCTPEGASDMQSVTEYTSTKKALDEEIAHWEEVSMQLEEMQASQNQETTT